LPYKNFQYKPAKKVLILVGDSLVPTGKLPHHVALWDFSIVGLRLIGWGVPNIRDTYAPNGVGTWLLDTGNLASFFSQLIQVIGQVLQWHTPCGLLPWAEFHHWQFEFTASRLAQKHGHGQVREKVLDNLIHRDDWQRPVSAHKVKIGFHVLSSQKYSNQCAPLLGYLTTSV
jgi:hypothetical protein